MQPDWEMANVEGKVLIDRENRQAVPECGGADEHVDRCSSNSLGSADIEKPGRLIKVGRQNIQRSKVRKKLLKSRKH